MPERIDLPGQNATLGSLLRHNLFANGGTFVACTVPHPQDDFLRITIESSNPKSTLLLAIGDARADVAEMIRLVEAHL